MSLDEGVYVEFKKAFDSVPQETLWDLLCAYWNPAGFYSLLIGFYPGTVISISFLLCTTSNAIPQERLFAYSRRLFTGASIPSWLCKPVPVLVKRHAVDSKADLYAAEVELLQANLQCAYIWYPDGREISVSVKHLAPTVE